MTRKGHIVKSRGLEPALPELERRLTTAAAARVKASKRGLRDRIVASSGLRIAAAGLACLAFGGTAMAATGVWNPEIGASAPYGPPPEIATTPVPAAMAEALGVFRREPTAQDHAPAVEATLSDLGSQFANGVRPGSVRFLEGDPSGKATLLLSAERSDVTSNSAEFFGSGEPACVVRPDSSPDPSEAIPLCFGLDKILAGEADMEVERIDAKTNNAWGLAWGLVPDGVATVTFRDGEGERQELPVRDNYFHYSWGDPPVNPDLPVNPVERELTVFKSSLEANLNRLKDLVWHDADGNVVPMQRPAG